MNLETSGIASCMFTLNVFGAALNPVIWLFVIICINSSLLMDLVHSPCGCEHPWALSEPGTAAEAAKGQ